jgi:hypothetical protein
MRAWCGQVFSHAVMTESDRCPERRQGAPAGRECVTTGYPTRIDPSAAWSTWPSGPGSGERWPPGGIVSSYAAGRTTVGSPDRHRAAVGTQPQHRYVTALSLDCLCARPKGRACSPTLGGHRVKVTAAPPRLRGNSIEGVAAGLKGLNFSRVSPDGRRRTVHSAHTRPKIHFLQ